MDGLKAIKRWKAPETDNKIHIEINPCIEAMSTYIHDNILDTFPKLAPGDWSEIQFNEYQPGTPPERRDEVWFSMKRNFTKCKNDQLGIVSKDRGYAYKIMMEMLLYYIVSFHPWMEIRFETGVNFRSTIVRFRPNR